MPHIDEPTHRTRSHSRLRAALIPLLLIVVTVAAYAPVLQNEFVDYDDQVAIYKNTHIIRVQGYSFYRFWTRPYLNLYAPLTYTLLAGISLLAHPKYVSGHPPPVPLLAWPFHATSLLLHTLTVIVVYRLLLLMVTRKWPAAAGALLFALHPVQVESVAWATEINTLLCVSLSLTAILLYLQSRGITALQATPLTMRERRSRFIFATQLFIFALLSKPLAVVVPVLAGILYWARVRRDFEWQGGDEGARDEAIAAAGISPSPGTPGEGTGCFVGEGSSA